MVIKTLVAKFMKDIFIPGYDPAVNTAGNSRFETARRFRSETAGIFIPADNSSIVKSDDLKTVNL